MADDFETFWRLYPKRKGRKTGKSKCRLWWEQNAEPELSIIIIRAVEREVALRAEAVRNRKFYPLPCDPLKWLYEKRWETVPDGNPLGDYDKRLGSPRFREDVRTVFDYMGIKNTFANFKKYDKEYNPDDVCFDWPEFAENIRKKDS